MKTIETNAYTEEQLKSFFDLLKEKEKEGTRLEKYIADLLFSYSSQGDEVIDHAKYIVLFGGQSGAINGHVYTAANKQFYFNYFEEINELYADSVSDFGMECGRDPAKLNAGDYFAWFAIEQTAASILNECGIDY